MDYMKDIRDVLKNKQDIENVNYKTEKSALINCETVTEIKHDYKLSDESIESKIDFNDINSYELKTHYELEPRKKKKLFQKLNNLLGEPIYIKESVGFKGNKVDIYKIRSMYKNADELFQEYVKTNGVDEKGNIKNDNRTTKIGSVLRKTWLDELPQIYNWLKGDLQLVGIRPMSDKHWDEILPEDIKIKGKPQNNNYQKPGLAGINYANAHIKRQFSKEVENDEFFIYRKYLDDCDNHGIKKTNKVWLGYILKSIFVYGERSN